MSSYFGNNNNNNLVDASSAFVRRFSFKIIYSPNQWIGFGMCHMNTALEQNYVFSPYNVGHGYYMISSNGGSWSSIDSKANNVVKGFKFIQGDII
jgi:hypothetical protein